ncbi:hypothetical protein M408DRAFT_196620 [Serendipita vermifera MAFF 305830]|uniref:SAM domain-containing protein n=1 Tax=Serendipita vermifera MAFF 305830 TaxID=933852 RepID=A0A0C2WIF5_SERVB|nr:hypothetical protein M408DRAFT_196620 [Serendipita vermifera MAFF 305830]
MIAPKIPHSGTTSITAGSDGNRGFIPITISMAMKPTGNNEYLNLYIKAISFQITTPTQNVPAPASTSSNPTSPSIPTSASTNSASSPITSGTSTSLTSNASLVAVPSLSVSDGHTVSIMIPISEPSRQEPQASAKVNTAAIGAAVGSVAFVAILIVLLVLWRRRRLANLPTPTQLQPFTPTPSEKVPFAIQPPRGEGSSSPVISPQQTSSRTFSSRAESTVQSGYFDPPPIYGSDERIARRPSMSPALVEFARANRTWISEDLQERLTAAGYLPTDDPDNLTEEEWRELGITKLELLRLRALFARTVQASPSTHSPTSTQTMFSPMSIDIKDRRSRIEEQAISPVGV